QRRPCQPLAFCKPAPPILRAFRWHAACVVRCRVQIARLPKPRLRAAPALLSRLAGLTALLGDTLPLKEPELGLVLSRFGLGQRSTTFAQLARLYRARGEKIPFGIVRWGGVPVGIGISSYGAAA